MSRVLAVLVGIWLLGSNLAGCCAYCHDLEGNCQPKQADDPDCLVDGFCAAECVLNTEGCSLELEPVGEDNAGQLDRDDPDCDPCVYDDSCDVCDYAINADLEACICQRDGRSPDCDYDVPSTVTISAKFAYDPTNEVARSYVDSSGMSIPAGFTVLVESEAYAASNDPTSLCALQAQAEGEVPAAPFTLETSTDTYSGTAATFAPGSFHVSDRRLDIEGEPIAGCSSWYLDPDEWGDSRSGMVDAIGAASWQFGWNNVALDIEEQLTDPDADDPNDDFDLFDLYRGGEGFVVGGSLVKVGSPTGAMSANYVVLGFDADDAWQLIEVANPEDPYLRIPWDEMLPRAGVKPTAGVYDLRSFTAWDAEYILLDRDDG